MLTILNLFVPSILQSKKKILNNIILDPDENVLRILLSVQYKNNEAM